MSFPPFPSCATLTHASAFEQIGNHLGALSQWQSLVKEAASQPSTSQDALYFSVVGLHALTVPQVSHVYVP